MGNIVKQKVVRLDDGKYVFNVQLQWTTATPGNIDSIVNQFGLGTGVPGTSDDFDTRSLLTNIAFPPIKSIQGSVNFRSVAQTLLTGFPGAMFITAPDTSEVIAVAQNRNIGGNNAGTPVPGIVGFNFVSFCAPIHTLGSIIRIVKYEDNAPAAMNGFANLSLFTFDVAPYEFAW